MTETAPIDISRLVYLIADQESARATGQTPGPVTDPREIALVDFYARCRDRAIADREFSAQGSALQ